VSRRPCLFDDDPEYTRLQKSYAAALADGNVDLILTIGQRMLERGDEILGELGLSARFAPLGQLAIALHNRDQK